MDGTVVEFKRLMRVLAHPKVCSVCKAIVYRYNEYWLEMDMSCYGFKMSQKTKHLMTICEKCGPFKQFDGPAAASVGFNAEVSPMAGQDFGLLTEAQLESIQIGKNAPWLSLESRLHSVVQPAHTPACAVVSGILSA